MEDPVGDRTTFAYDLDNQLVQVEDAAGAVTTYTYNALQQRVGRDVDGDVTQFLWDGVNLRQESQAGVVEADYTLAPQPEPQPYGDLVSQHRDTDSSFYHFDALGSTRVLTDAGETVTDEATYRAFGETAASSGTTAHPFGWVGRPGYYQDEETGLADLRRRKYDPATGAFTTEDPLGFQAESDFYRYVRNNPATQTDPSGLKDLMLRDLLSTPQSDLEALLSDVPTQELKSLKSRLTDVKTWRPADPAAVVEGLHDVAEGQADLTPATVLDLTRAWSLIRRYHVWVDETWPSDVFYFAPVQNKQGVLRVNLSPKGVPISERDEWRDHIRLVLAYLTIEQLEGFITDEELVRSQRVSAIDYELDRRTRDVIGAVVPPVGVINDVENIAKSPTDPWSYAGLVSPLPSKLGGRLGKTLDDAVPPTKPRPAVTPPPDTVQTTLADGPQMLSPGRTPAVLPTPDDVPQGKMPEIKVEKKTKVSDDLDGSAAPINKPNVVPGVLDPTARANVWKLQPTERGQLIEKHLAQTDYQDWFHVGAEQRGYFPLIDFQKGQAVVSLKTANTKGGSWIGDLQSHIDDLATRGVQVNDRPANLFLDLRVQPGGLQDAQQLIGYGKKVGVTVRIQEF